MRGRLLTGLRWALAFALAWLFAPAGWAQTSSQPIFGPFSVTLPNTSVLNTSNSFDVPASATGPYLLRVKLSAPNSLTTLSYKLNNAQVLSLADFSGGKTQVDKTVIAQRHNTVTLQIAGKKGTVITVTAFATPNLPRPTSLAPDPLSITAGATGNLTATISPPPSVSGALAVSSANGGIASVPASVSFAAGQTQVVIPVGGVSVGNTTVTASLNGGAVSATVSVTPAPPTITSLTPGTLGVTQGGNGTLTVTISSSQTTNTGVSLASSNSGIASVPSSVTVPAGQVSASISVGALAPGNSDITANLNGTSAVSHVTVTPAPPRVVSLVPAVATVTLGASTTLTLTISSGQSSDTTVPLAVSPEGIITAPAQVVVPAGQTSVGVTVDTLAFGQAGIVASLNGSTASAAVNVVPQPVAVVSIVPTTLTMNVGATSQFTVSINATQPSNTQIALSVDHPSFLQLPPTVTVAQGQTSATFTATGLAVGNALITASANNTSKTASVHVSPQPVTVVSLLPSPLPLQQGASGTLTLTVNVAQETDTAVSLANTLPAIADVPASVTIPAGTVSVGVPVTALSPGSTNVIASVNGTSVESTVTVTLPPPVVTSLTPATLSLPRGTPGTLRVTVSRAPNTATAVALSTTNPSIAWVPTEVNIAAGTLFADLPVIANSEGQVTITAALNGGNATSAVTISPAELVTLTLSPQTPTDYVGETVPFTATGTMTDGTTQDFTTRVTWTSSDTAVATIPSTGVATPLAAGQTTIAAGFTFTAVQTGQPVTISQNTVLTVKQPVALVLAAPTTNLIVGQNTTVTVSTADPASIGGLAVALTGSGAGAGTFPDVVTIPENGTQATFTFIATGEGSFTLAASAQNRLPATLSFTILPQFAISAVSPAAAEVGAVINLIGAGFDPNASGNQLSFRGINNTTISVAPISATTTQIAVKVPALAESGPITLTNFRGTIQSPPFTVSRDQNFQLVVSPAALAVFQGSSSTAQAQLASTGAKPFTGLVTLSVTGLPNGVTASFAPAATLSAFQTGSITLGASAAAAPGTYNATVQAAFTEGGLPFVRTSPIAVTVSAAANVTGIKGRFVTPEGQGIAGIIVRADIAQTPQPQTTTDAAGNFTLVGLPAGAVTFRFDATPANPLYPIWPYTTTVVANQISRIPDWTINPPPPDERFTPINNATQAQIITDARFPGLEVKLPTGVTITGWDGVVKTRIAVERHAPDKLGVNPPPIPTRSVFQLYFGTPMGGIPSAPIPVTFPNDAGLEPGQRTNIWYYDGSPMGGSGEWKIAGQGTVSADGKVVVPDANAGIPRFCGHCGLGCIETAENNAPNPPCPNCSDTPQPPQVFGASVTLSSGQENPSSTDLSIAGLIPLSIGRTYNPFDAVGGIAGANLSLGQGWAFNYDVIVIPAGASRTRVVMPGNSRIDFTPDGAGAFEVKNDTRFYGAKLKLVSGFWELTFKDGRLWRFASGAVGAFFLIEQRDTNGNSLTITRNGPGLIQSVQGSQRSLAFTYGANGFVSTITDPIGRTISYAYNSQNRLSAVVAPDGGTTNYTYADDNEFPATPACPVIPGGQRLQTIKRPGQTAVQTLFYGPGRRVLREILEDGSENKFSYATVGACVTHISSPTVKCTVNCPTEDSWENFQAGWRISGGSVSAATFIDANGKTTTQRFNGSNLGTQVTDSQGQTTKYERDSSNRVTSVTDPFGRTTKYQYDANGNKTKVTDSLGRVTDYTYDPKWNKVASITRYLADGTPVTQQFTYDANTGDQLTSKDPLNNITTYVYTAQGQLNTTTVPGNRTTTMAYGASGDLLSVIDPLGNTTQLSPDQVGRLSKITDALSFETENLYNSIDQMKQVFNAAGDVTTFSYDAKRNLSSVVNPLNIPTERYQYDSRNKLTKKTDAKGKSISYQYDTAGNIKQLTDRKGQITTFAYDNQNRVMEVRYPDATQIHAYDANGRLSEIREGLNTVSIRYDDADHTTRVVTDSVVGRNEVGYEYDTLDRIVRRTVNGGDPTIYSYDNASRLLTITYRNQTTVFVWDNASRLTAKTLPNGIKQELAYDDADRLLSITYKKADNTVIEQITYSYDAKGQRITQTSGVTSLSETPVVATYDSANRLITLAFTETGQIFALDYDDNGNLATKTDINKPSDVAAYTWDSRNRLVGINAPGLAATFVYDALGRRASKTINGQTIGFVYDGAQAIGEIVGGTISATILTTLGIDDVVARYTQAGDRIYLVDALSSVIAQAKGDLAIQNFYSYSAYGQSQALGVDEGNSVQFNARENDGTELYYYRARYYDPVLKRFISEDPIGMAGGLNMYAFARGAPTMYTDPDGLCPRGYKRIWVPANGPGGGSPYCVPQNPNNPNNQFCATGECAAGISPAKSDMRTQSEVDRSGCEFMCGLVMPGGPIPLSCKEVLQMIGSSIFCGWWCKDPKHWPGHY